MPEEVTNDQPQTPSQPIEPPQPRDTSDGSWQTRSLSDTESVKK